MLTLRTEIVAFVLVLATLAGVPVWVAVNESRAMWAEDAEGARVITLTAVAAGGIWTEEDVVGHSYWRRTPRPARPVVRVGETVILRLKSPDVTHSFSIPDFGVGPIEVGAGHVSEVRFIATEPGEYLTQCSTRCGPCHEEMLGTIVVLGPGQTIDDYPGGLLPERTKCTLDLGGGP